MQRLGGNRATVSLLRSLQIQPKLTISEPGDPYEEEADHVADQVMRMAEPEVQRKCACGGTCSDCQDNKETPTLRRTALGTAVNGEAPPIVHDVLRSAGQPLDGATRAAMEQRLGVDLHGVRVHTDTQAAASAERVDARAYTVGNHIVFGRGQWQPGRPEGDRLIAHELTHVAQQSGAQGCVLQRQDIPGSRTVITTDLGEGLALVQFPESGRAELRLQGATWVRFEWDRAAGRDLTSGMFGIQRLPQDRPPTMVLTVRESFRVRAVVDRNVEEALVQRFGQTAAFEHHYEFGGRIDIRSRLTGSETLHGPVVLRHTYTPSTPRQTDVEGELGERPRLTLPRGELPAIEIRPRTVQHRVWTFRSLEGFRRFAASHPDTTWAGIATPDGQFIAYALTERALQRIAHRVREGRFDFEPLNEFPGSRMAELYLRGQQLESLNALHDLYYNEAGAAAQGSTGDSEECEVFRMGRESYGRLPLTHEQALTRWRELDDIRATLIEPLETSPGRRFEALQARGASRLHYLDRIHFEARDDLLDFAAFHPHFTLAEGTSEAAYLRVEADREREDPRVRRMLQGQPEMAEELQGRIFADAERMGQEFAINAMRRPLAQVRQLADSDDAMQRFVVALPLLQPRERLEALRMIGIDPAGSGGMMFSGGGAPLFGPPPGGVVQRPDVRADWRRIQGYGGIAWPSEAQLEREQRWAEDRTIAELLADRRGALNVLLGLTWPSIGLMRERARSSADGLQRVVDQLERGEIHALRVEGEFGNQVRRHVYREMGFRRLTPESYPHGAQTEGVFPDPLSGLAADFTTLAEQLFANRAARMAHEETAIEILKLTGIVALTVILIIVAQEAGALIAGGLFGLAEGTTAFAAVSLVSSAAIFTALNALAMWPITGEAPTAGGLAGQFALNVAMFGFFEGLGNVLKATSQAGARALFGLGEEAFQASRAAQATAGVIRVSATTGSFITFSILEHKLRTGEWPSAGEAALIAYQNVLMIALLETGTALARPLTDRLGLWARARQLRTLEPGLRASVEQLFADINTLSTDLSALATTPQVAPREAGRLADRQQELLRRQRELVERLREPLRTQGAAQQVDQLATAELNRIDASLEQLRQARYLQDAGIRPLGGPSRPGDPLEFSYASGGEDAIRRFYGADRVRADRDGVLRVQHEGRLLVFRPAGAAPPPAAPPAPARAEVLSRRQRAIVRRADALGLGSDPTIDAIRRLQPERSTNPRTLRRTERLIADAERALEPQLRERGREALRRHTRRLRENGMSMSNVLTGELASMTRAEVGEVLAQIPPGVQGLGEAQLRGVLFAARGGPERAPIDVRRVFELAGSAAERNFVLETFGRAMEQRIPGADAVLRDMITSPNKWRGGSWVLEYARVNVALDRIAAFEVREQEADDEVRVYDIILTDGTRLELKNWRRWWEAKVRSQFQRDVILSTGSFANPERLSRVEWIFRSPAPRSLEVIRETMRQALEELISAPDFPASKRDQLRRAFQAHDRLVQISSVLRTSVPPTPAGPSGAARVPPLTTVPSEEREHPSWDPVLIPTVPEDDPWAREP